MSAWRECGHGTILSEEPAGPSRRPSADNHCNGEPRSFQRARLPGGPQTGYYSDIAAEAAARWESLCQNHPFVNGNKRTDAHSKARQLIVPDDVAPVWRQRQRVS